MGKYVSDREFTNTVHQKLAIPKIYNKLGWKEVDCDNIEDLDINHGIDYVLIDSDGKTKHTVQERFRESQYGGYNDCTLRYTRDHNSNDDRKRSEFFKIEADYLVYGIIDTSKKDVNNATDFIKYVVVDLKLFREMLAAGRIKIDPSQKSLSKINGDTLIAGFNFNGDRSSEFVVFDVGQLVKCFGNDIILTQNGFKI